MMSLNRCIIIVALCVVYLTIHANANANNKFCGTARENKKLCEKMVDGSANWNEAITKALTHAMNKLAKAHKSGNSQCAESYASCQDNLKESMKIVRKENGKKKSSELNSQLSSALTYLGDCSEGLEELNQNQQASAAKALNRDVTQAISVCLAINTSRSKSAN